MDSLEELEKYYGFDGRHTDRSNGARAQHSPSEQVSTPATDEASTSAAQQDEDYATHVLTKSDTLAGLAVTYNVAVSDIKRANALMSENMMWSR